MIHLHGNIRKSKSSGPKQEMHYYPIEGEQLTINDLCPDGYPLRPHVVWFGEAVPELETGAAIVARAAYLIVVGTSLNMYPAAGLIHYAKKSCEKFVIDPKAESLNVGTSFIKITTAAVDGVKTLATYL